MTHGAPPDQLETLRRALAGQYEIDRLLGQGGMGSVYLARDPVLDRPVAIKVFAPGAANAAELRERFVQEARLVARLRHPGIVQVFAAGEVEGQLWFAMEYVAGESLSDRMARDGRIDGVEGVTILRDLARALAYAHAQGVVHRDVKPENVLLEQSSGRALLADFGVARALGQQGLGGDARMTHTGFVVGSPRYMSPEQASGDKAIDGRSDIYSLGLVGYEMIAGVPAVAATTPGAALVEVITRRPPPLEVRPSAPQALVEALDRALEKDPEARWATASEFAEALDEVLAGMTGRAPAGTSGGARRAAATSGAAFPNARVAGRRAPLVAGVAALLAVVGVAALWLGRRGDVPAGVDPRKSFLVAPFEVQGGDPQLQWLREGSVSMLTLNLAQWSDLSVVDYERSLDLLREAKLDGERRIALEQASDMARRAKAWTVVMGTVQPAGDSLLVSARLYDVATGKKLDEAQHATALRGDPRPVFDLLARDLLNLVGAPADLPLQKLAQSTTGSLEAYRAYLDGSRALNGWRLAEAESLLAVATTADTTFALAYYKRALTMGWKSAGDTAQGTLIRRAILHGDRLPARQRDILVAYRDLTDALASERQRDTARTSALFVAAQQKYAAIVERDSTAAEAWYGLADALWHHRPGGWGSPASVRNWSRALRAFNRTLALDSTFHLAYSHKLDLYQRAGSNQGIALDGDSLVFVGTPEARRAFGEERLRQARERARALAISEARAWSRTDPVPQAYFALAALYIEKDQWDSALAVIDEALTRPGMASPRMLYLRGALMASRGGPAGLAAVREALQKAPAASLRREGMTGDLPEILVQAGNAAAYAGGLKEVDAVAKVIGDAIPTIPGAPVTGALVGKWWSLSAKMAMGVPVQQLRRDFDATMAQIEKDSPGELAPYVRGQIATPLYLAYLATRDEKYMAAMPQWAPWLVGLPEIEALRALARGDTAKARAEVRRFTSADSVRKAGSNIMVMRWMARGQVYEELGEPRRALEQYDLIEVERITHSGRIDVPLPLVPRSWLVRARLQEQLGEREAAIRNYRRFLEAWAQADPSLDAHRRLAREGLARLGDAGGATAVPAR